MKYAFTEWNLRSPAVFLHGNLQRRKGGRRPMASLPTRKLGRNGPKITRIGLGAWAIGGGGWAFGWGPQDDAASLATMRRAVALGIDWIDTAAVYGLGHSEQIVGRFLRELPAGDRPYVFTKCGLAWDETNRMGEIRRD